MGKIKSNKNNNNNNDFKAVDVLQAVVLADSFNTKLRPVTLEVPKVLLPLVNIPMLSYTLEFLAAGGIEKVYVVCCSHAESIQKYLNESGWKQRLHVTAVVLSNIVTPGDALREVYKMNMISGDFVLISGDVISNIKLNDVINRHRTRVTNDKNYVMTVVMKKVAYDHRTKALDDDRVVAMDNNTGQLLVYENHIDSGSVRVDVTLFEDHPSVVFRYDLMDCHIDICTQKVLDLFMDQFDYQDVRKDFISGVLGSEILGDKIAVHEIRGEYAARIRDYRTYDSVSKDIIQRWSYPIVLDNTLFANFHYSFIRGNIYKEDGVTLARSAKISDDCVIGKNTNINENSIIEQSVIGRNCKIGNGVLITNSYIWGDTIIHNNVKINNSVICNGVIIHENAIINAGSIISFNVIIDKNINIPAYSNISCKIENNEDLFHAITKDDIKDAINDINIVGPNGRGNIFQLNDNNDDDSDDDTVASRLKEFHPYSLAPILKKSIHELRDVSDDDLDLDPVEKDTLPYDSLLHFYQEVEATIKSGYEKELNGSNFDVEDVVSEVVSLKLAHDVKLPDYGHACSKSLINIAILNVGMKLVSPFKMTAKVQKELQKNFIYMEYYI